METGKREVRCNESALSEVERATNLVARLEKAALDKAFRGELVVPAGEEAIRRRIGR